MASSQRESGTNSRSSVDSDMNRRRFVSRSGPPPWPRTCGSTTRRRGADSREAEASRSRRHRRAGQPASHPQHLDPRSRKNRSRRWLQGARGEHMMERHGNLAAPTRLARRHQQAFADTSVQAVTPFGRLGSARLLPHLDFDTIRRNPKVMIGYSYITALLLLHPREDRTVTFPGPIGWDAGIRGRSITTSASLQRRARPTRTSRASPAIATA